MNQKLSKSHTILNVRLGLKKKEFSCLELTKSYLKKIAQKDQEIGAFLSVSEELALEEAREVDDLIEEGRQIPALAGVPYSVKDVILVKDLKCTAASKLLENYRAVYDATCVAKLKAKKAIVLGKTNLDEFAMGSSTEHSAFKQTKNPHDTSRVPGGTSGGSAAAVAADMSVFSLGSDTGGSIRQPASFCGVVGLKPTYGAVSRYGLIAHASSLDQIGPLAKTVEDVEIVFGAIKGKDEKDSTSVSLKPRTAGRPFDLKKAVVGLPKEYFSQGLLPEVREKVEGAVRQAEERGAKIEEISLPHSKYALACYYIISTSEASANLARYDGIKYGLSEEGKNLLDVYLKTRESGFGSEVKRRIMLGTFVLSSGYYDAYYLKAQKVRTLIRDDFKKAFEKVNFIFAPVSPFPAFGIGDKLNDPLQMYLSDIYTVSVNLAGLPAISLPVGEAGGLPVGLQIIGSWFNEADIFSIAREIEAARKSG